MARRAVPEAAGVTGAAGIGPSGEDVSETAHRALESLRAQLGDLAGNRGKERQVRQVGNRPPGDLDEATVAPRPQLAAHHAPGMDELDDVPEPGAIVADGLAHEEQATDLDVQPRLLVELSACSHRQALAHVHATPREQPVPAACLEMLGEEDAVSVEDARGDAKTDLIHR